MSETCQKNTGEFYNINTTVPGNMGTTQGTNPLGATLELPGTSINMLTTNIRERLETVITRYRWGKFLHFLVSYVLRYAIFFNPTALTSSCLCCQTDAISFLIALVLLFSVL